ncbi:YafY family transcriptional regulator [Paenibacillus sp. SC116]|uniref:helix-turn-helix transcriptional regulator n=1 Tax=Paenibacillus sp. SC116 TaxID=2968986 RepID=UPI00215A3690|nr:YafY family protein [Paenibacillus sp. SC116]MCR8844095.1 YafY family transcriptional regulator [Paenibacillus sp. SC116]
MKLERLLSILIVLLNRRQVMAKELADQFEVSIRTIYRDIETLNMAGIPIMTQQGANGGIRIMDGYKLERNVLTYDELASILTALQSLSTAHTLNQQPMLAEKLQMLVPEAQGESLALHLQRFRIDLSTWGKYPFLELHLTLLKHAVEEDRIIQFQYVDANGTNTERVVHAYTLLLKSQQWYLYGYCTTRSDFRLFKLFRMKDIQLLDQQFDRTEFIDEANTDSNMNSFSLSQPWNNWTAPENTTEIVLSFEESAKSMAEERFGVEALVPQPNGTYQVTASFPADRWLDCFILGYGPHVEVLSPPHLRDRIGALIEKMAAKYRS